MQPSEPQDLILFYDTETTDLPEYKLPSDDPKQPHLVELAALLYTRDGVLVDKLHSLVRPDGWTISEAAFALHGISLERAHLEGDDEAKVTAAFLALHARSAVRVAHHRAFDDRIMRIALKRYIPDAAEAFKERGGECTALLSKPICQLPPTEAMKRTNFKNSYKTPTLAEAFAHLSGGKTLPDQHSALGDAQGCARVYFLMKGVRMPEFPDDADVLREGRLPHGKDECDAAQLDLSGVTN